MKNKLKNVLSKKIFYVILGIIIVGILEIVYASNLINSKNVSYSNSSSKLTSTNVQGAIDELYNQCSENEMAYNKLKKQVVTSGDGLYQDETESNKYFYRGKNPNNFIKFNNELWRIININEDGSIRIRRNESIGNYAYDNKENGRDSSDSSNYYCSQNSYFYGCALWGAINTVKDTYGNSLQSASRLVTEQTTYKLPDKEAYLNTYLNTTYYQTLSNKDLIKINAIYNIGSVRFEYTDYGQTIKTDINQSEKYKWFGKIALIDITDYPRTNSNQENCGSIMQNISNISPNYASCKNTTWIYNSSDMTQPTINHFSLSYDDDWKKKTSEVWGIHSDGSITNLYVGDENPIYPVLTLKSNLKIKSGTGEKNNPFVLE